MEEDKNDIIQNFKAMMNWDDDGIAFQYLESNNWNLVEAWEHYQNTAHISDSNQVTTPAPAPVPNPGGPDVAMEDAHGNEVSAFEVDGGIPDFQDVPDIPNIGQPSMDQPEAVPQAVNPPAMGLQNVASQFSNLASNMASNMQNMASSLFGGMGGGMGGGMEAPASIPQSNRRLTPAQEFLLGFRRKNGTEINLPPFVNNTFEELGEEARRLKRPIFLYLHNDKGESCSIVDLTVIGDGMVSMILQKYICVGINVNTNEGSRILTTLAAPKAPFVAIVHFDENGELQNIGSESGDDITTETISNMDSVAMGVFDAISDDISGNLNFNIADSSLELLETEEFKAEIIQSLETGTHPGYQNVPGFRRQPEIDPETGFRVGMTQQQIDDQVIRDRQREELKEAQEKDRVMLEERRKKEEEDRIRKKEELEKKAEIERLEEQKKETAEVIKANLPDEPAEGTPDTIQIQFRFPDGMHKKVRRFHKSDTVGLLYDYIASFGNEEGFEAAHTNFDIVQNYPKKFFEDKTKTLKEEGLSNCALMIKEHSHIE